jgi:hypothetical protein
MNHARTLLKLSVDQFFSQCNWTGQPLAILENADLETVPEIRLSLLVSEYFRLLPWEGTPTIGSLPKVSANFDLLETDPLDDVTLEDLLDSF